MANNLRAKSPSNRRPPGLSQLTRTSTENDNASYTGLPQERQIDSSATNTAPSAVVTESARIPLQRLAEGQPPKYDEIYPHARTTVSRRPARARPSPPTGMDPLVAAMWHNENLNLLLSLPDRLLVKIIQMLSNSGVECIRRVARRFPHLCVREILSPLRGSRPRLSETGPFNWPRFGTSSYLRPQFLELVDRDEYCHDCQAARKSPQWEGRIRQLLEYIHCSACGADHPACLFSATQRLKPARMRYCIAHEGYMRICDHEDGTVRLSRLLGPHRRQPWYLRDYGFDVQRCKDPSHAKPCRRVPGGFFPKPKGDCGSRMGMCNGHRWPTVLGCESSPEIFDVCWTAHIPFNGQMDALRPHLADIRANAGRYIVPCPASATERPEIRCFDPNDCHCVTYSGAENVRWEWECGPWLPGTTKCISDPFKGLNALLPPRPSGSIMSNIIRSLKLRKSPTCTAEPKSHQSRLEPSPPSYGLGRCAVNVRPCHTGSDCLVVDYIRSVRVHDNGKITSQWYNTIEPCSYKITDDQDGLGVYWCPQSSCRNYYKALPNYAGILRRREYRKECRHYDCQ